MAITTYTTVVTAAGSIGTKGSYTQVVASTPYASSRLILAMQGGNGTLEFGLTDLAKGAGGSEVVIVANIQSQVSTIDSLSGGTTVIHVDIPAGTRLALRRQSSVASAVCVVVLYLESRAIAALTDPVTYGADLTFSKGTPIDPGGTAGTKGVYVQLTASTSARMDALVIMNATNSAALSAATTWQVDIAIGASGSEVIVVPDVRFDAGSSEDRALPVMCTFPVSIASGSRLAVRCQCNRTTAVERLLCISVMGMQEPASTGGVTNVAPIGHLHHSAKLSDEKVREIRELYRPRVVSARMLATQFGVTHHTILRVLHRRNWIHIS